MATLLGAQLSTFDLETVVPTAVQSQSTNDFRLTLTTALPVTTGDVTAATTIYFTPYIGNKIALYSGSAWVMLSSAEASLAVGTITADLNYDIFAYSNSGTLTLEALAWTNDTTRATALVRQDGVWCKTGVLTRRYVGTFRTTATTTTEDSAAKRFLWNMNNRVERHMAAATETTDSWTYTTAAFRAANNNTANRLQYVAGLAEGSVAAAVKGLAINSTGNRYVAAGVGVDSVTTNSAQTLGATISTAYDLPFAADYVGSVLLGYHYLQWLEYSEASGTTTWNGDAGQPTIRQSGIVGRIAA